MQPRNTTPNLQVSSRLKSPDLLVHHQSRGIKGNGVTRVSGGIVSHAEPQKSLDQPSGSVIYVNETALINKDLDMVEAAANLIKQRSIELPSPQLHVQ